MKKKIFILGLILTAVTTSVYLKENNKVNLLDLTFQNIEALARNESGNDCRGGCAEVGWGSKQIVRCECSKTGWFSSCSRWGC